jgi:hypothetical protein
MKYGSRKFIVAVMLIVSASALSAYDKLDSGGLTVVLGLAGAGYGMTNVASRKYDSDGTK